MSELRNLSQDLVAHAHEAPPRCAELMRAAAKIIRAAASGASIHRPARDGLVEQDFPLADADPRGAPIPPPEGDNAHS